ncbi:hypothetical protein AGDE_09325 [Angomonas deanei]|nr:hypothetical protein AGDE_09325 [Angomonas deanei]|eukprot:EPY30670.1 hypothetical protein AGDE_09325 [Angomonas deanei]
MSVARNLSELRAQGEAKYKEKDYVTAAKFFKDAIGVFLDNRVAEPNCIEEFVKVASNLCMCYYSQKDLDNCVTTARELISVYPIVPKAFGCIGMCIMDRICEQDEQLSKSASGEDLRGNLQRYVVKVGGVLCSVDEAHTYLLRAVLLSNDTLKVTLGPYIDTAVRYVSEQLLSAPTPLERLGRGKVLDQCCPEEDGVPERPNTLSTSEVVMKPRLRLFDAATNAPIDLKDKHPTQEEMEAIVAASGAQEEPSPAAVSAAPIDFMLSDQPVPVRVCHSERGGLPRGLTLLRVESAFAISNWLKPKAGPVSTVRTGPDLSQGEIIHSHVDPTTGLEMGMVMMPDEHMGQGGEAPASVSCVCCGKEGSGGYAANYSFCQTCEAAAFCSPECRDKYRTRHDKYECPLLVKLREVMTLVRREKNAASKPKHKGANPRVEEIEDEAEAVLEEVKTDSDVLPGSGWTNSHLQRRTLPLTFAVYGGIMNKAPGWEKLLRVVERGVHHQVRCWIPEQTQRVLELMAPELPSFNKLPTKGKTEAADFLTTLFMLTRLYGVPRTDSDTCAFFVERTYFRHSCEPNCSWSDALRSYTTTRYVYKGEELRQAIDPDFPQHWPLQIRRKWLARHHGFLCKCDRCIREETRLNHARGDLSNDVTEQLLTADALKREGKAARHPTHHFHSACIS